MISPDEFFDSVVGSADSASSQAALTTKDNYAWNHRFINIDSHSQREILHECPRKFQQFKIVRPGLEIGNPIANLDFNFGHAVGAGVQCYIVTGSQQAALFAAFLSWKTDSDAETPRSGKSLYFALLAVLKFINFWNQIRQDWEVASFNGKAASELTFWLDCENGHYHAGHIDVVLRNKVSGYYTVVEIKTTSMRDPSEAMYGNSGQALGYSVMLDTIAGSIKAVTTFQVLYFAYSSTRREWIVFPFTKSRKQRAEWLQDLLLDQTTVNTYVQLGFFPKRGNACWSFNKTCQFYGVCDLHDHTRVDRFHTWELGMDTPEQVDYIFKLSEVMKEME